MVIIFHLAEGRVDREERDRWSTCVWAVWVCNVCWIQRLPIAICCVVLWFGICTYISNGWGDFAASRRSDAQAKVAVRIDHNGRTHGWQRDFLRLDKISWWWCQAAVIDDTWRREIVHAVIQNDACGRWAQFTAKSGLNRNENAYESYR